MKRVVAVALCGIFLLTGCTNEKLKPVEIENTTFDLISDRDTNIIYIRNLTYCGHYVYTPYYSENGKLCKFVDNKIVEVNEDKE